MTQSVAVTGGQKLTLFAASFSTAVDFRAFFSGTCSLRLKMEGTAVDFNTRLRCTANPKLAFNDGMSSKQSTLKCSLHRTDAEVGFQFARVRWTCLVHKSHKCGSFGKRKSETLSLGMFPQAAATQRFGMMLLDEYKRPKTQYTHVHNNVNRRGKYGRMSISGRIYLLWWRRSRLPPLSAREKARCSNLCNFLDFTKLLFFGLF